MCTYAQVDDAVVEHHGLREHDVLLRTTLLLAQGLELALQLGLHGLVGGALQVGVHRRDLGIERRNLGGLWPLAR